MLIVSTDFISVATYDRVCRVKPWLLAMGFSLSFGGLFAKTYRVHRIFNRKKMAIQRIHDSALFALLGAMLAADCIILIPFTAQSPMQRTLSYGDTTYNMAIDTLVQEYDFNPL